MPIGESDIFVLPFLDKYLLYSPLRRISAFLNRKAVEAIRNIWPARIAVDFLPDPLKDLAKSLESNLPNVPLLHTGEVRPPFLGILPTRGCNLSCAYCGFGSESAGNEKMDIRMAADAVDWMAEHRKALGEEVLEIHFFGGEPLIAQEVVDVTVHRARFIAGKMGLVPRFEASTNGVIAEDYARFAGDYLDSIVLSFDGRREVQDRHRPLKTGEGSFDAVARTAGILSRSQTELCFRCCVSTQNVSSLVDIGQWFCDAFKPSIINFETLKTTPESEAAGIKPPDPYDFALNYLRARKIIRKSGIQAIYAAAETGTPRHSFCPVGKDTLIVSPGRQVSSCYLPGEEWKARGLDLDVARLGTDGSMDIDYPAIERLRLLVVDKQRCERCFCRWNCAGGCHVTQSYPSSSADYNDFCIQTRIITASMLMEDLGMEHSVERLIESREAMEALALNKSDRLEDWDL
jgi:uncharacterized protein